jgi:hypothetical protein
MALLAVAGASNADLTISLRLAEAAVLKANSSEALAWLQLGLFRHGLDYRQVQPDLPLWTTRDVALRLLSVTADSRSNLFMAC